MKLRTQLVVAFLILAIVPLAALTIYSYSTSIRAYRRVMEEEAGARAAEMRTRMTDVSRDLSRRIERVGALPLHRLVDYGAEALHAEAEAIYEELQNEIGEDVALVQALKYKPAYGERGPSSGRLTDEKAPSPPSVLDLAKIDSPESVMIYLPEIPAFKGRGGSRDIPPSEKAPRAPFLELEDGKLMVFGSRWAAEQLAAQAAGKDRDIVESIREAKESLSELPRAMEEAKLAVEMAKNIIVCSDGRARAARETAKQKGEMNPAADQFDKELPRDVHLLINVGTTVESSGQRAGTVTAEVSLPRVMQRVFAATRVRAGETPFAIDNQGHIYCSQGDAVQALQGLDPRPGEYSQVRKADQEWVVVAKREPASGLTFGIARPIGDGLEEIRKAAIRNLGLGLGLICVAMVGILPLSRRMTRGLTKLTKGAKELATGNLDTRVAVTSRDEIGELATSFNQMAQDLSEHQKRLVHQKRLERELELCQQIQKEMLPKAPLKLSFAEVQGVSIPAREVGGDFFNFFPLPDDRMAILVGDVSGKGIAAAMLMANLQATLRAKLSLARDLAGLMTELDGEVSQSTPDGTFLTLFVAILDNKADMLQWASAGHDTQYLLRSHGGLEPLTSSGRPLGLLPGGDYEEHQLPVQPGDSLFLYTDGLVEAENELGEEFGLERLEAILRRESGWGLDTLIADVEQALRKHRGPSEAHDDTTMVVLKTTERD